jgi:hypothetical protein
VTSKVTVFATTWKGGKKETTFEAHLEKVGFQDWVVSRWVGSTVNVVKIESWLAVMLQQRKVDIAVDLIGLLLRMKVLISIYL